MESDGISYLGSLATLDESSHIVYIHFDRVSVSFEIEEFLDFYRNIKDIKDVLISHPGYVVGTTEHDGVETAILVPKIGKDEEIN
jgi:hypothetical protein